LRIPQVLPMPRHAGWRTLVPLALLLVALAGCRKDGERFNTGEILPLSEGVDARELWQKAGYETVETAPGALPDVSAELGGTGFEALAESQGWSTRLDYPLDTDSSALAGGRIRISISEYPATLRSEGKDAHTAFQQMMIEACYETLLRINSTDLEFQPALATHWKVSFTEDGGQELWFRLNPEARWQTGQRVTAADVAASWKLKTDEGLLRLSDAIIYREFSEPEAVSPYILRTRTQRRSWRMMSEFATTMRVYPAHIIGGMTGKQYMDEYQNRPLPGSGRYLIREQDLNQGNSLTLTRVADYWDRANPRCKGEWNFYQIKFVAISEDNLARERTKKGELDLLLISEAKYWVRELTPERVLQLRQGWLVKQKVQNDQPNGLQGFVFNTREEPFRDVRLRKAFALLMDRQTLIDKLFYNQYLHNDSYYPGGIYENPDNPKVRYDPQAAIRLLESAGYAALDQDGVRMNSEGERLEFEVMSPENPASERLLTVIQEQLQRGGIKLNLKPTTFSTRVKMLNDRKFQLYYGAWTGSPFPDPRSSWHSEFAHGPDTGNHPGVADPYIDSLCAAYDVTYDQDERVRQIQAIDRRLMDGYYVAHAWYGPYERLLYWNKFGMPERVLSRTYDYRDLIRLWWYDPVKHRQLKEAIRTGQALPIPPEVVGWQ
jgi:microcin C transport system substrate-binding protein